MRRPLVPSMWFWSVSWSTNCPVYFSLFLVDQKNICSVPGNFWSISEFFLVKLWFFGILKRNFGVPKRNLVDQKNQSLTKNSLRLNKFFFGRPKKVRNRPDNWSTKRLTKTTWTGLMFDLINSTSAFWLCGNMINRTVSIKFDFGNLSCSTYKRSEPELDKTKVSWP